MPETVAEFLKEALTSGAKVYCVICIDPSDRESDPVHIFSTQGKATAYADADLSRNHVLYDYVIDCPERMEGRPQ